MNKTNVVNLGAVREVLPNMDKVRSGILDGSVAAIYTVVRYREGNEQVYVSGVYRQDPREQLRASLKLHAARTLVEDEPPLFQASAV